jgi:hypothetical protein
MVISNFGLVDVRTDNMLIFQHLESLLNLHLLKLLAPELSSDPGKPG